MLSMPQPRHRPILKHLLTLQICPHYCSQSWCQADCIWLHSTSSDTGLCALDYTELGRSCLWRERLTVRKTLQQWLQLRKALTPWRVILWRYQREWHPSAMGAATEHFCKHCKRAQHLSVGTLLFPLYSCGFYQSYKVRRTECRPTTFVKSGPKHNIQCLCWDGNGN